MLLYKAVVCETGLIYIKSLLYVNRPDEILHTNYYYVLIKIFSS